MLISESIVGNKKCLTIYNINILKNRWKFLTISLLLIILMEII